MKFNIFFALSTLSVVLSAPLNPLATHRQGSGLQKVEQRQSTDDQSQNIPETYVALNNVPVDSSMTPPSVDPLPSDSVKVSSSNLNQDSTLSQTVPNNLDSNKAINTSEEPTAQPELLAVNGNGAGDGSRPVRPRPGPTGDELKERITRKYPENNAPTYEELYQFVDSLGTKLTSLFEIMPDLLEFWNKLSGLDP